MGEGTTISLLTSINDRLKTIIENTAPQNKSPEENTADVVKDVNKSDVSKKVKTKKSDLISSDFAKELSSSLTYIATSIKDIAKIKDKDLDNFKDVLTKFVQTFVDISKNTAGFKKGSQLVSIIATSLEVFSKYDISKVLKQFKKIDDTKSDKSFADVLETLVVGIQNLRKLTKKDFERLGELGKAAENTTKSFKSLSSGIAVIIGTVLGLTIAMKKLSAREILKAFGVIALMTTGLGVIAVGLSALSAFLEKKIGHESKQDPFQGITKLMTACTVVAYGVLGLGAIMNSHMDLMLTGIAGVALVMVSLGTLAVIITAIGNKIMAMQVDKSTGETKSVWSKIKSGLFGGDKKESETTSKQDSSPFGAITKFMLWSFLLTGATFALGALIQAVGFDSILYGIGAVGSVILAYGVLAISAAFVASLITGADKLLNAITKFTAWGVALTLATIVLGAVVTKTWEIGLIGLGAVATTLIIYSGIAILAAALGQKVQLQEKGGTLKSIMMFIGFGVAIVSASIYIGKQVTSAGGVVNLLSGFAAVAGVLGVLVLISKIFASKWVQNALKKITQKTLMSMAYLELMVLGAAGVVWVVSKVAKSVQNVGWDAVLATVANMILLIGGFSRLAIVVGRSAKSAEKGIITLANIELLALGAAAIIYVVAKATKSIQDVGWGALFATMGSMAAVITEFGLLAAAASLVAPVIAVGAPTLAAIELVALGAVGLVSAVANLVTKIESVGGERPLLNAVNTVEKVIIGFKKVMGLSTNDNGGINLKQTALNILGNIISSFSSYILLPLIGVSRLMIGLVNKTVELQAKIRETNFNPDEIASIVKKTLAIFSPDVIDIKFSAKEARQLRRKMRIINDIIGPLVEVVTAIGTMAKTFAGGVRGTGNNTELIPLLGIDKSGNAIYGNPVNLREVATAIVGTIDIFTDVLDNRFGALERKERRKLKKNFKVLSTIIEPISQFAQMVANFAQGDTLNTTITKEDGTTETVSIDLRATASRIVQALNTFASELFTTENMNKFYFLGQKQTSKGITTFATILEPINSFVEAVSKIVIGDGNTLTIRDDSGKEITVDIISIASGISKTLGIFIDKISEVFLDKDRKKTLKSMKKNSDVLKDTVDQMTRMASSLNNLDSAKILSANSSLVTFLDTIKENAISDNLTAINSMALSVTNVTDGLTKSTSEMTTSITKLDDILVKKSDNRIKELNALADAMKKISDNSKDMESALDNLKDLIETISTKDMTEVQNAAEKLGSALGSKSNSHTNTRIPDNYSIANTNRQSVSTITETTSGVLTKADIFEAFTEALSRVSLRGFKVPVGPERTDDNTWGQAEDVIVRLGVEIG